MRFIVNNISEEDINIRIRVDSMGEASGSSVQLCFGVCVYQITQGMLVPSGPLYLEAGGSSLLYSDDDHFWNYNPGNGSDALSYHLTFVRTDDDGNVTQDLIGFTYTYSPLAGTDDFKGVKQLGINVNNTVVSNTLEIDATKNAKLEVFDTNGKLVKTVAVKTGNQAIDLSSLTSAIYFARFTTDQNRAAQIKIVKN